MEDHPFVQWVKFGGTLSLSPSSPPPPSLPPSLSHPQQSRGRQSGAGMLFRAAPKDSALVPPQWGPHHHAPAWKHRYALPVF